MDSHFRGDLSGAHICLVKHHKLSFPAVLGRRLRITVRKGLKLKKCYTITRFFLKKNHSCEFIRPGDVTKGVCLPSIGLGHHSRLELN